MHGNKATASIGIENEFQDEGIYNLQEGPKKSPPKPFDLGGKSLVKLDFIE